MAGYTKSQLENLRNDIVFDCSLLGYPFRLHSTWGVFSPREVDRGTLLLLDHLDIASTDDCLDIGCGYGPLGLAMARQACDGVTHLLDKDFVAVDYASKNAVINKIDNVEIYLSNGLSAVAAEARFDVIVSNLPAKAGKELFYLYFHDARARMRPGARIYVVTINGLRQFIKRSFSEIFGNYKKIKQGADYTVSVAEFDPEFKPTGWD